MGGWTPSRFRILPMRFGSWIGPVMASFRGRKLGPAKEDPGTWVEPAIAISGQMPVARRNGRIALDVVEEDRRRNILRYRRGLSRKLPVVNRGILSVGEMNRGAWKGGDPVRMNGAAHGAVPIMVPVNLMRREGANARSEEIGGPNRNFGAIAVTRRETSLLVMKKRGSLPGGPAAIASDRTAGTAVAQRWIKCRDSTIALTITSRDVERPDQRRRHLASIAIADRLTGPPTCFDCRVAGSD